MEKAIIIVYHQSDESFAQDIYRQLIAVNIPVYDLSLNMAETIQQLVDSKLCIFILSQKYLTTNEILKIKLVAQDKKIPMVIVNLGIKIQNGEKDYFDSYPIFDAAPPNEEKAITNIRQFILNMSILESIVEASQEKLIDLQEILKEENSDMQISNIQENIHELTNRIDVAKRILANPDAIRIFKNSDFKKEKEQDCSQNKINTKSEISEQRLSKIPLSKENKLSEQRQYFLKDLIDNISQLKLSRISPEQVDPIMLSGVYIDVPTNVNLHLEINDYQITNWWVNSNSTISDKEHFSFDSHLNNDYDISSIKEIVLEAQDFITGKDGGISPKERNRPLIFPPLWENGIIKNYYNLATFDVANASDRLVITGVPGSGKSTFAHYLALFLAQKQLSSNIDELISRNISWHHGSLTPIMLDVRRFVNWKDFPDVDTAVNTDHFWNYVCEELLGPNKEFANELWNDLIFGRALIIFDGLDEATAPIEIENGQKKRLLQIASLAKQLGNRFSKSRIIFTSRPYEFESIKNEFVKQNYKIVNIEPLDVDQMSNLAFHLYKSVGLSDELAEGKTQFIIQELTPVYDYLKNRPLFLTLMVMLSLNSGDQRLPTTRGALLHQSIFLLVDRWTRGRLSDEANRKLTENDTKEIYNSLENIAYRAQGRVVADKYQTVDIDIGEIYREFRSYRTRMYEIVDYLTLQAGIFDPIDKDTYKFAHRTFQEFLAASYLVHQGDYEEIRRKIQNQPISWRESCILIGDLLSEENEKNLWNLIDNLIDFELSENNYTDTRYWNPIWLCCNLIINHKPYLLYTKNKFSIQVNSLKSRIKILLSLPKILPPADRVQCGIALGYLGDDRFGVGVKDGLPEIEWCHVPGGDFQMGLTGEQIVNLKKTTWAGEWEFGDEIPSGNIYLPDYFISRYPITIAQFQTFMHASDGYLNNLWWTDTGLIFRDKLISPLYNEPSSVPTNNPQNEITWYDAMAFCKWLSFKLGYTVKLPSEAEWEKAARGTDGRFFPWGNDYDPQYCNVAETGLKHPSPVGCFAFPNGPRGKDTPLDMCGNIWEWCTTVFQKDKEPIFPNPYNPEDGRENIEYGDDSLRIVRGGSYTNIPFLTRITARGRDKPSLKHTRQGFRIVKYQG